MVPVVEDFLLKIEQSSRGLTSPKLILPPLSDLRLCALFPNLTVDWRRWTSRGEVGALTEGPHVAEWIRSRKRVAGQNHRHDLKAGWGARAGPLGPPTSGHPPLKFRSTGLAISWGGGRIVSTEVILLASEKSSGNRAPLRFCETLVSSCFFPLFYSVPWIRSPEGN